MLREILLHNFGRFRDRKFDLAATTVFYGPNEAGKTTIFDALFYALCRPPATRRAGKLLRDRYGADADSRLVFSGEEIQIDDEEFRNLHAVRAGDVAADLQSGDRWLEKVRASLFAGGLDPRELAVKLRKQTKNNANLVHNKERRKLTEELEVVQARTAGLRARREQILSGEKRLADLRRDLAGVARRLERTRVGMEDIEADLAIQDAARDRQIQEALLSDLELIDELDRRLARALPVAPEDLNEFDRLEGERVAVAEAIKELERDLETERKALEELRTKAQTESGRGRLLKAMREEAVLARDRLRDIRETAWRTETIWKPLNLVGGAIFTCLALGCIFLGDVIGTLPATVLAVVAACAGAGCLVFARRTRTLPDQAALTRFIGRMRNEWNRRFEMAGGASMPPNDEDMEAYFAQIESEYETIQAGGEELQAEIARRESLQAANGERRKTLAAQLDAASETIKNWLERRGVTGRDDLLLRQNEITALRAQFNGLQEKIQRRYPDAEPAQLRRDARRKLETYDETGIPARPIPEANLRALRARRQEAERKIKVLEDEERRGQIETEGLSREMSGSLLGLPGEIIDLERRAGELESSINERDLDREAAGLAADLFEELAADTELALQELAADLSELYQEMLEDRGALRLTNLELKNVLLEDRSGDLRPLEHCSTGTRDAFLLAARLTLARKTTPDLRLLVLDEPFLSLDAGREREVLEFLAAFQSKHDWQFLIFTKEERLRDSIQRIFPETVLHEPAGYSPSSSAVASTVSKPVAATAGPREEASVPGDVQEGLFSET